MDIESIYKSIFELTGKDFKIEGVRRVGGNFTQRGKRVFKFIAILSAPAPIDNLIVDSFSMTEMINKFRRSGKRLAGPDLLFPISWTVKNSSRKKHFNFSSSLNPMTVFSFEVFEGRYYIKIEMYGAFY